MNDVGISSYAPHWTRLSCEGTMLRVDCFDFYKLGHFVHPLTKLPDNALLTDTWIDLYFAKNEINTFFITFPLKTSRNPALHLYQALTAIIPDDFTQLVLKDSDGNPRIMTYTEANSIRDAARELETVLKAELNGWDAYFVSQKGAFSTSDLINKAESMLPESAQTYLSAEAREDIRQSGRCLAFSLGTAAAFHIVRATETFIWKYYEAVVGHLPVVKMRNWGAYSKNLRATGKADSKVIGWLDQIRDEYRNPVLHPDEVVTADDALEFINACLSLMSSIGRALTKIQAIKALEAVNP